MAQFDQKPGPDRRAWTDGWDGYPAARQGLPDSLHERSRRSCSAGRRRAFLQRRGPEARLRRCGSPVVASEFVGTSITSQAWPQERLNQFLPDNPHMKLMDSRYRGYTRVEVSAGENADGVARNGVGAVARGGMQYACFVPGAGRQGGTRARTLAPAALCVRTPEPLHRNVGIRRRPADQEQAVERLDAGNEPQRSDGRQIAEAERGVGLGREVEAVQERKACRFLERADVKVLDQDENCRPVESDLQGMRDKRRRTSPRAACCDWEPAASPVVH